MSGFDEPGIRESEQAMLQAIPKATTWETTFRADTDTHIHENTVAHVEGRRTAGGSLVFPAGAVAETNLHSVALDCYAEAIVCISGRGHERRVEETLGRKRCHVGRWRHCRGCSPAAFTEGKDEHAEEGEQPGADGIRGSKT
jgi:hypothetical protein